MLETPLLPPHQQSLSVCDAHPTESVSEETFRKYANEIDGLKIVKRAQQLIKTGTDTLDVNRYLAEVLACERLSHATKKEIVTVFPDTELEDASSSTIEEADLTHVTIRKTLLVVMLSACHVSQEVLGLLMGVSKTSMHYWIAELCTEDFEWQMLREITCWSGKVSVDEKWINIKGEWYVVLCAVDRVSGFPLSIALYPTLDTVSWTLFFKRFRALYGRPALIQSDGSQSLAAARELVFAGVRWQLCTFHTLKNLMKRLRKHVSDAKSYRRCTRLAKHIFSNVRVSRRTYAAKPLQTVAGPEVRESILPDIFSRPGGI